MIIRETLQRIGACVRWAPTWLQLADALTKENAEAMDILRAAMVTNQYHLHDESLMMRAAAEERSKRLQSNNSAGLSASAESCEIEKSQASAVLLATSLGEKPMVKVSVSRLSEVEVRA